jgi:cytochrome P450
VLNWTWYLLSQHPQVEARLADEVAGMPVDTIHDVEQLPRYVYTCLVIEEALRLYPPGWLMTRRAVEDDEIGGYFVPRGTEIYISPYLIQRHPGLWEAPELFDPERFTEARSVGRETLATLPFSIGPRNCIGEFMARVELQIHLVTIARRLQLSYVAAERPQFAAGVNLLSKRDFMMTPRMRV